MLDFNTILTLLGTAGGLAVLYGVWLNRSKVPLEVRVLDLQGEKLKVDAHKVADDYVLQTLIDSRLTIDRLRNERDELKAQIERLLEEQKARHEMVNRLHVYRLRWELLEAGKTFEEVKSKKIEPIYNEAGEVNEIE